MWSIEITDSHLGICYFFLTLRNPPIHIRKNSSELRAREWASGTAWAPRAWGIDSALATNTLYSYTYSIQLRWETGIVTGEISGRASARRSKGSGVWQKGKIHVDGLDVLGMWARGKSSIRAILPSLASCLRSSLTLSGTLCVYSLCSFRITVEVGGERGGEGETEAHTEESRPGGSTCSTRIAVRPSVRRW